MVNKNNKFHEMRIVSDMADLRNKFVLEVNSNGDLEVRFYDKVGNASDDKRIPFAVSDFCTPDCTESNMTGKIKRTAGMVPLISESAVEYILNLAQC